MAVTLEQCWHRVPGGTARAALECCRALLDAGRSHRGDAGGGIEQVGVAARHRHPPPPPWVPPVPVRMLPLPRPALYEAWHALRRPAVQHATGAVDVVHATGMAVPPPSAPLVVTVHDLAFLDEPGRATRHGLRFFRRSIELARRDATLVIAPSQATVEDCVRHGFDRGRLRLVPWGVDARRASEAEIASVRARHRLSGRLVLWTGTIEPRKNLPGLLDAFARVTTPGVTLVLAGPRGWNEDLEPRLARLGDRVRPLGFVDPGELRALYAAADLFCLPSLKEGFGLPVLEAMAQATPVITSSVGATAEVVGDAGIVVDPRDTTALATAIDEVLGDPARARALAAAGLARADEAGWDRTALALAAVYREAAGHRRAGHEETDGRGPRS